MQVEAYGARQPLSAVAQVNAKGPQLVTVNVFDPSVRASRCASDQCWTAHYALALLCRRGID